AAFFRSRMAPSIPWARSSMSGSVSQSAVIPNAIVPASDVTAIDRPMVGAIGMIGYWARSRAPPMYIGTWGPGTFDTTRLMNRARAAVRAAIAWIDGGDPTPMYLW